MDSTYWYAIIGTCATAELAAVILCGCFPMFPPFFKHIANRQSRWEAHELGSTMTGRSTTEVKTGGSMKSNYTVAISPARSV
jgi:hypothetical protein